jgi:hypothetical protein
MTTQAKLTQLLDELEASLPQMIKDSLDEGDFWMAFAGESDVIEDQAGDLAAWVFQRMQAMLAPHGMSIGVMDHAAE